MMTGFLGMLIDHNAWATRVLLLDAERLSDEQFTRRFEIGLGSVHDTLRHIIGAMLRWADRMEEVALRPSIEDDGRCYTVHELRDLLEDAVRDLCRVAEAIEARGGWGETIAFVMPDGGKTYHFTRVAAMTHVLTHGVHHRAQVLNIRRQLGLPPLGLDLDVIEWECVQTRQIENALALAARASA